VILQNFKVDFAYPVYFTDSFFDREKNKEDIFAKCGIERGSKFLFVIDSNVVSANAQLTSLIEKYFELSQYEMAGEVVVIPGGESSKNNFDHVNKILTAIDQHKIDRHSYIVAIGGGAVLDAAGFAAAIAHRGIRHLRFPTTVLSQNDSGVGVKNGINYFGKKNFLGTFAPPFAVINDYSFLKTLSDRDFRCGISEAIKVGLIKDKTFFEFIESNAEKLNHRDEEVTRQLIFRCAEIHVQHNASGDPFEQGNSRPLDYGHWSAHKLEQLSGFNIRHGEAVAMGMCLDAVYANKKGLLSDHELMRVVLLMKKLQFKLFFPEMDLKSGIQNKLLSGLQEFREHLGGELTIMLIEKIGKGIEVHEVEEKLMLEAIVTMKKGTDN
jgi:3-dehydroquinate synthase